MVTSISEKLASNKEIVTRIDDIADTILNLSEEAKDKTIDAATKYNEAKPPYTAAVLAAKKTDAATKKILTKVDSSFEQVIRAVQKNLANNYATNLTKAELATIAQKKSLIIDDMIANNDRLKAEIKRILISNLGKGIPASQLVKELKDFAPAYARNASTIVNTGLMREYQDINVTKFKQNNYEWYLWAGPDDKVTREKPCKHWVKHRFPASQLDQLSAVRQTLWNCRHSIIPLSQSQIENYPIGDISFAS